MHHVYILYHYTSINTDTCWCLQHTKTTNNYIIDIICSLNEPDKFSNDTTALQPACPSSRGSLWTSAVPLEKRTDSLLSTWCAPHVIFIITLVGLAGIQVLLTYKQREHTYGHRRRLHDNACYEYGDFSIHFHCRGAAFTRGRFCRFINGS